MPAKKRGTAEEVVFEDPPEKVSGLPTVKNQIAALYDHPGEWARIGESVSADAAQVKASHLKSGKYVGIEKGEFDTRFGQKDGKWYVWAVYNGSSNNREE
jgi:hypothetical protein